MATIQELKSVLKETLENRGVLGQIQARVRAEVFNALDDQTDPRPPLSNENMLINELVREYLQFNKYKYTESVLLAESGQPTTPLDRQFLTNELNITADRDTASVPLLYGIIAHFLNQNKKDKASARSSTHRRQPSPSRFRTSQLAAERDLDFPSTSHGLEAEPLEVRGAGGR
ncbi:centrosomal protein 20-like [Saccoglossus kowalevskii]|uniref:LisH domain-containing protein FOPNL-like n=1 Tax=Saccoglossus kowalevskii TaxID=10224 RepID=A0ABM0GMN2_SACKO|nr:PREDICTED: lisH domain-containing protein FOPNL-like [Saccoglossus kowalevskii]